MLLNWLKNKSPKKDTHDGLPKWSSNFIQASPPKKTGTNVIDQWLKKEDGEPSAKQPKTEWPVSFF